MDYLRDELKYELERARRTIIRLMPYEIAEVLRGYEGCETREEAHRWPYATIKKVLTLAVPLPKVFKEAENRANCPLCNSAVNHVYQMGFKLPTGLERHLEGLGNVPRCEVMEAAIKLAHDYWEMKFGPAEKAEKERQEQEIARRKREDILYLTDPSREPEVRHPTRGPNDERLAWIEGRIAEMGFVTTINGRLKQYVYETEGHAVYADPLGGYEAITLRVFKKPVPKRPSASGKSKAVRWVTMPDRFKHNLRQRFLDLLNLVATDSNKAKDQPS